MVSKGCEVLGPTNGYSSSGSSSSGSGTSGAVPVFRGSVSVGTSFVSTRSQLYLSKSDCSPLAAGLDMIPGDVRVSICNTGRLTVKLTLEVLRSLQAARPRAFWRQAKEIAGVFLGPANSRALSASKNVSISKHKEVKMDLFCPMCFSVCKAPFGPPNPAPNPF